MTRALTIRQRAALRRIARSLAAEDPVLAQQLRPGSAARDRVLRLGWLPPVAFLVLGMGFTVSGIFLELGSAVMLGFGLLVLAHLRRSWLRRHGTGVRIEPRPRNRNWQNG